MSTSIKTASVSDSKKEQAANATSSQFASSATATTTSAVDSSSIAPNSCRPTGCSARCTPACSNDEICSLATMQNCGVCPPSQCVSKAALDLPTTSTPDIPPSGPNIGLIVGLTVGLVGGLLLFIAIFLCWRRRRRPKSHNHNLILPTNMSETSGHQPSLSSNSAHHQDPRALHSAYDDQNEKSVAPSLPTPDPSVQSASVVTPQVTNDGGLSRSLSLKANPHTPVTGVTRSSSMRVTRNEMRQKRLSDNPFDDLEDESKVMLRRAVSVKKSQRYPKNNLDSSDTRPKSELLSPNGRDSITSIYSAAPAIQVMRAKPMVVRVDSLKGRDGRVTRKTSQRALSSSQSDPSSQEHSPATEGIISPSSNLKPSSDENSKSVIATSAESSNSQNMDGEITIFWDSKN